MEEKDNRVWIDEGSTDGILHFNDRNEVINHIKGILRDDNVMLANWGYANVESVSEDDLFEIAHNHYSISEL